MKKRRWGFPVKRDPKTGKVLEVNLYMYEQLELAKENNERLREYKTKS